MCGVFIWLIGLLWVRPLPLCNNFVYNTNFLISHPNRLLSDEIPQKLQPAALPLSHAREELHLGAWGGPGHAV